MQQRIVNGQKTFLAAFYNRTESSVSCFFAAHRFIDANDVHSKSNTCLGSRVSKHI